MSVVRGIVAAAVVAALVAGAAGAGRAGTPWKTLPYFDFDRQELYIGSGHDWTGAKRVGTMSDLSYRAIPSWAQTRGLDFVPMWSASCGRGAQVMSFKRTFSAPGVAAKGELYVDYAETIGSKAIMGARLFLNGVQIGAAGRSASGGNALGGSGPVPLGKEALNAFRFGKNTLELALRRAALPTGRGAACNDGDSSHLHVGIGLSLVADFRTDLSVGSKVNGQVVKTLYRQAVAGGTPDLVLDIDATNNGPSASVAGAFTATIGVENYLEIKLVHAVAPPPFGACSVVTTAPLKAFKVTCPYTDFPPGKTVQVTLGTATHVADTLPVNFASTSERVEWHLSGGRDLDPNEFRGDSNNGAATTWILCGRAASDPGCASAPGG